MPKAKTGARQTEDGHPSQLEFPLSPSMQQALGQQEQGQQEQGRQEQPQEPSPDNEKPDMPPVPDMPPAEDAPDETESPTFAMVRESGIDGEKRCLYLVAESTQGEQFRLDFTPGCIPLVVAALSAELGFLRRHQPDAAEAVQPIVIDSCQLGETANGSPALLAGMEGGGELPLQMKLQDLRQLARQIDDYIRARAWGRPQR